MKWMTDVKTFIQDEIEYRERCSTAFRKHSYGDKNIHKKYRVLCNRHSQAKFQGILSTVSLILPNIIEARNHGYIPVIDLCMNSRPSIMLQERELAKRENAWEYYFTQPDREISLKEVRQSKYVEEQMKHCINKKYYISDERLTWDAKTQNLSLAVCQNIHLQQRIKDRVRCEKQNLLPKTDKVLGVGIRAGYRRGILTNTSLYNGHPLVDSCVDYIKRIEKRLSEWNYNYFFLEVDDRGYLEEIKKYFGNSCIYFERPRKHYFKDALKDIPYDIDDEDRMVEFKDISMRSRNEEYLIGLYLLAQCDSLYASRGTGHNFSYLLNRGKYAHVEFIDSGNFVI